MRNCDPELLRRSLIEQLSEAEEDILSSHLTECQTCQKTLENLAGRPAAWSHIGTTLQQAACINESSLSSIELTSGHDYDLAAYFAVECLDPSSSPEFIGRLGDIDIHAVIGHGGMGVVLRGFQPELRRLVAVKVLAPHLALSAAARKRFAREAQATAAILHPNVMPILTVHSTGKLPYLVMPYIACESLQQRIDRTGTMDLENILRIGIQTANGLAAAHAQGLVHRDVKPANILLEIGVERVMLTDFGLARAIDDASITRTGIIAGTPLYMSPEQARGEPLDARSDLFSLGSVLYTLATGRPPFRAESTYGILRRLTDDVPRPVRQISPQLPKWFEGILQTLLAKLPKDRFRTASEVAQLLEGCLAHLQQPALVPLPKSCHSEARTAPTRKWAAVGILIIAVSGVAWQAFVLSKDRRPSESLPHISISDSSVQSPATNDPAIHISTEEQSAEHVSPSHRNEWDQAELEMAPLRRDFEQWHAHAKDLWESPPP